MTATEFLIGAILGTALILVPYFVGYSRGKKDAARTIFKALNVPEDCVIESVSYRKVR